jgi:hypothetical protein
MPGFEQIRHHARKYSDTRRRGIVGPQDVDSPPDSVMRPRSASRFSSLSSCRSCEPGCACCTPNSAPLLPTSRFYHHSNRSTTSLIPRRRSSVPLPQPQSFFGFDGSSPSRTKSLRRRALTNGELSRYVHHNLSQVKEVDSASQRSRRWPFGGDNTEGEEVSLDLAHPDADCIGPLSALLYELNDGLHPGELLFSRLVEYTNEKIWAEQRRISEMVSPHKRLKEVHQGVGTIVQNQAPENWQSAEVVGYI